MFFIETESERAFETKERERERTGDWWLTRGYNRRIRGTMATLEELAAGGTDDVRVSSSLL